MSLQTVGLLRDCASIAHYFEALPCLHCATFRALRAPQAAFGAMWASDIDTRGDDHRARVPRRCAVRARTVDGFARPDGAARQHALSGPARDVHAPCLIAVMARARVAP